MRALSLQINEAEPGEDSYMAFVSPVDEVLVAPGEILIGFIFKSFFLTSAREHLFLPFT